MQPLYLRLLVSDMAQHGLQAENFALPALLAGFVQQAVRVFLNQHQARELSGVHSEHRAANTCVLMGTIRLVGSEAVADYVHSKSELLEAVALRAIAETRLRDLHARDADAILLDWGRGLREVLLAHPGVAGVLARQAVIGHGGFKS